MTWETPSIDILLQSISSPSNPIGMRMRAAYFLRQAYETADSNNNDDVRSIVVKTLGEELLKRDHGSLMRHEFAYVMGQLRDERCCSTLEQTLSDTTDCTMVRHECAEALAAINSPNSLPLLEKHMQSSSEESPEVSQTCQIAVNYMRWKLNGGGDAESEPMACACMKSPYSSIDPAPPHPHHVTKTTLELGELLRDDGNGVVVVPLFERYRAMFSLRNRGGEDAVLELGKALVEDESSALLRHEVAYVLGQMQHPASVEALAESLRRKGENEMVRHEAAEALGAIEGRWEDCEVILKEFLDDEDVVVRESCMVALDSADYWGHGGDMKDEDEDRNGSTEKEKEVDPAVSFGKQKAVTNGKRELSSENQPHSNPNKDSVLNHFNVLKA